MYHQDVQMQQGAMNFKMSPPPPRYFIVYVNLYRKLGNFYIYFISRKGT